MLYAYQQMNESKKKKNNVHCVCTQAETIFDCQQEWGRTKRSCSPNCHRQNYLGKLNRWTNSAFKTNFLRHGFQRKVLLQLLAYKSWLSPNIIDRVTLCQTSSKTKICGIVKRFMRPLEQWLDLRSSYEVFCCSIIGWINYSELCQWFWQRMLMQDQSPVATSWINFDNQPENSTHHLRTIYAALLVLLPNHINVILIPCLPWLISIADETLLRKCLRTLLSISSSTVTRLNWARHWWKNACQIVVRKLKASWKKLAHFLRIPNMCQLWRIATCFTLTSSRNNSVEEAIYKHLTTSKVEVNFPQSLVEGRDIFNKKERVFFFSTSHYTLWSNSIHWSWWEKQEKVGEDDRCLRTTKTTKRGILSQRQHGFCFLYTSVDAEVCMTIF